MKTELKPGDHAVYTGAFMYIGDDSAIAYKDVVKVLEIIPALSHFDQDPGGPITAIYPPEPYLPNKNRWCYENVLAEYDGTMFVWTSNCFKLAVSHG